MNIKFFLFLLIIGIYIIAHLLFTLFVDLKWIPPPPEQLDPEGVARKKSPDGSLILRDDFLQDSFLSKSFSEKEKLKIEKFQISSIFLTVSFCFESIFSSDNSTLLITV